MRKNDMMKALYGMDDISMPEKYKRKLEKGLPESPNGKYPIIQLAHAWIYTLMPLKSPPMVINDNYSKPGGAWCIAAENFDTSILACFYDARGWVAHYIPEAGIKVYIFQRTND